jgi:hypothetical protein
MANTTYPGFQPYRRSGGLRIGYRRARVLTNNTLAIGLNDAVIIDTNGDTLRASTVTTAVSSVSGGASFVDANNVRVGAKSLPAATLYTSTGNTPDNASFVFVVDNSVEVDYVATIIGTLVRSDLNNNAKFIAGAPSNGLSTQTLDGSGLATTATFPFRVQDFYEAADNDQDGANPRVLCKINAGLWEPALSASLGT